MALAAQETYEHEYSIEELELHNSELQPAYNQTATNAATSNAATNATVNYAAIRSSNRPLQDDTEFATRRQSRSRRHVEWRNVEDLPHSHREHSRREWDEQARDKSLSDNSHDEAQSARHASRRAHRTFRLTWAASVVGAILFAQLLGALYLKALAVSASHRESDLDKAILTEETAKSKTQRKLSLVSSDPRMEVWAATAGYRMSNQSDLDDVMKPKPLPQPRTKDEYSNDKVAR